MSDALEGRVRQIIAEQLQIDAAGMQLEASFIDDLGADSLDIVELVMAMEDAFQMDIPDEAAEKIQTVKDAVEYIRGHGAS
jgi:acyl carrier protein